MVGRPFPRSYDRYRETETRASRFSSNDDSTRGWSFRVRGGSIVKGVNCWTFLIVRKVRRIAGTLECIVGQKTGNAWIVWML